MVIHLIRHAHAGHRKGWLGSDQERPLSARGEREAAMLADCLGQAGVDRCWSSPFVRCRQTLEPLADATGAKVRDRRTLAEGADGTTALDELVQAAEAGHTVAACSHGDVIPRMVVAALEGGAELTGPASPAKAGRYELTVVDGCVDRLLYVPAPTT